MQKKRIWLALLCLGLAVFTMAFAACGDDDDDDGGDDAAGNGDTQLNEDEQAAADYMNELAELFNTDTAAFIAEFEDEALQSFLEDEETPIDELRTQAEEFLDGETVEIIEFTEIEATADSAIITLLSTTGGTVENEEFVITKENDDFQITGYTALPSELPSEGVLDVSGIEFAFEFDGGAAEEGVSAISFANDGEQPHQIVLLRTAEDAPELDTLTEEALQAEGPEDLPESLEAVVGETFAAPGDGSAMVFADPLEGGRYVMFCFIPDETQGEEGPSHAALGMAAEFTVQ